MPAAVLEPSTPAAASTSPSWVSTIRVSPRLATTRMVSASMARLAVVAATRPRPSALLTTLLVTTTIAPSRRSGTVRRDQLSQVVPPVDLGQPLDRRGP